MTDPRRSIYDLVGTVLAPASCPATAGEALGGHREAHGIDDTNRADKLLKGVVGKRLTYATKNG